MRNKRGQFFLIAAIIIIGIVISFASVVNSVNVKNPQTTFYTLAEEVEFETKAVLNYGVYNQEDESELIENFLSEYADYISQDKVLFVYGNLNGINGLVFQQDNSGSVGIITGSLPGTITIQQSTLSEANVMHEQGNKEVFVEIEGIVYEFNLRSGENFFFVIIKEEEGESFVATE